MATPPLLDFEQLLAPLAGEDPAGPRLSFEVRQQLDEPRREIDPANYPASDPLRPASARHADWSGIVRLATEVLTTTSKDLIVAARLTEALVKLHGFAGLRDGLHLMGLLVTRCWDRLNPPVSEEAGAGARAAAFRWLDDPDRGGLLPSSLRLVPLLTGPGGRTTWTDWQQARKKPGPQTSEALHRAVELTSVAECENLAADIRQSGEVLDQVAPLLEERFGAEAPSLSALKAAVHDCAQLIQHVLEQKGVHPGAAGTDEPADPAEADLGQAQAMAPVRPQTRERIFEQLQGLARELQELEPHSPVPYLIFRAVRLGALPFPRLMKEFVRDNKIMAEMNRELGIDPSEV